jgi:hypothetical protein
LLIPFIVLNRYMHAWAFLISDDIEFSRFSRFGFLNLIFRIFVFILVERCRWFDRVVRSSQLVLDILSYWVLLGLSYRLLVERNDLTFYWRFCLPTWTLYWLPKWTIFHFFIANMVRWSF